VPVVEVCDHLDLYQVISAEGFSGCIILTCFAHTDSLYSLCDRVYFVSVCTLVKLVFKIKSDDKRIVNNSL